MSATVAAYAIFQIFGRDIDGTLGMSALRFEGTAPCVAKPLESSMVEYRHSAYLFSLHLIINNI